MIAICVLLASISLAVVVWAWRELEQQNRAQSQADNREALITSLNQQYGVPLLTPEQIRELHAARWDGD